MQTMSITASGTKPPDVRSFDVVTPVDVTGRMKAQDEALAEFAGKLERKKAFCTVLMFVLVPVWFWVELEAGPKPLLWLLVGFFAVSLYRSVTFGMSGPGPATLYQVIPESELLAILTNGLPEHLSAELVDACRKLAAAQSGRLLRSQFDSLREIDRRRRLRAALGGANQGNTAMRAGRYAGE